MEHVQPGYLHYYFVERHLFGFATETQRHGSRPWTYYVPVLLAGGLPVGAVPAVRVEAHAPDDDAAVGGAARPTPSRLASAWLLTGWIFLSAAGSKLFTYALPLFPAIALLATVAWMSRGDVEEPGVRSRRGDAGDRLRGSPAARAGRRAAGAARGRPRVDVGGGGGRCRRVGLGRPVLDAAGAQARAIDAGPAARGR